MLQTQEVWGYNKLNLHAVFIVQGDEICFIIAYILKESYCLDLNKIKILGAAHWLIIIILIYESVKVCDNLYYDN